MNIMDSMPITESQWKQEETGLPFWKESQVWTRESSDIEDRKSHAQDLGVACRSLKHLFQIVRKQGLKVLKLH